MLRVRAPLSGARSSPAGRGSRWDSARQLRRSENCSSSQRQQPQPAQPPATDRLETGHPVTIMPERTW